MASELLLLPPFFNHVSLAVPPPQLFAIEIVCWLLAESPCQQRPARPRLLSRTSPDSTGRASTRLDFKIAIFHSNWNRILLLRRDNHLFYFVLGRVASRTKIDCWYNDMTSIQCDISVRWLFHSVRLVRLHFTFHARFDGPGRCRLANSPSMRFTINHYNLTECLLHKLQTLSSAHSGAIVCWRWWALLLQQAVECKLSFLASTMSDSSCSSESCVFSTFIRLFK